MSDEDSYFNGNENNELPEGSKTSRDRVHRDAVEASVAFTAEGHAWTVSDEAYPGALVG